MKGALVAPTRDTVLNYNFCQSNNQFEEAATHDLKSQHPKPHRGFIKREFGGALLALIKSSFPKFCGCLPGRRAMCSKPLSVWTGELPKLQSCAILMSAQAIFCLAQKHTCLVLIGSELPPSACANKIYCWRVVCGSFEISARDKGRGRTWRAAGCLQEGSLWLLPWRFFVNVMRGFLFTNRKVALCRFFFGSTHATLWSQRNLIYTRLGYWLQQ